ncbi:MAG: phosphate ABC transporter substrate-binding protein PstS family protein [Chitinivibrionales bacterium]|nr:phosphate ABC transporter substrate-binding protein PstS family protein [Chitinivibrionales bacterium]
MRKHRWLFATTTITITAFALFVYARSSPITIKGSDTMVILAQRWAEAYMAENPEAAIQVTGGGSGTGISALINGTTDICNASRPMKRKERIKLKQRYNTLGVEIKSAKDGVAIYVNKNNPVKEITLEQLKDIYTGKITNWKELGGNDARIIVYGRDNSSGTYVYLRDNVLKGKDYTPLMQSLPGTAAVVNAVVKDVNGIGYGGAAFGKGIKFLKIQKDENSEGFAPNLKCVTSGNYPITRYLYMYIRSKPTGEMKKFIDWVLSDEGQAIVSKVGYFPLR